MSKINNLIMSIEDDIRLGVLSFQKIADKYNAPLKFVTDVWDSMCETEFFQDENTCSQVQSI